LKDEGGAAIPVVRSAFGVLIVGDDDAVWFELLEVECKWEVTILGLGGTDPFPSSGFRVSGCWPFAIPAESLDPEPVE